MSSPQLEATCPEWRITVTAEQQAWTWKCDPLMSDLYRRPPETIQATSFPVPSPLTSLVWLKSNGYMQSKNNWTETAENYFSR